MVEFYYDKNEGEYLAVERKHRELYPLLLPKRVVLSEAYLETSCVKMAFSKLPSESKRKFNNYFAMETEQEEEYYLDDLMGD